MLEAIIFDIGNVLLAFDFGRAFQRIAPHCEGNILEQVTGLEPLKADLESGRIAAETFLEKAAAHLRYKGPRRELIEAWQQIFEPIEATHQLVNRLQGVVPLFLLSNTNSLHAEYFLSEWEVFSKFTGSVFSHEAGMMKPDQAIYEHTISSFGLNPARTLFVDDLEPNVAAGRVAGLQAHHYAASRHDALLSALRACGLPSEVWQR